MRHLLILIVAALGLTAPATFAAEPAAGLPNPFFAFDNAGGTFDMLKDLGYAGQSGRIKLGADEHARELEARGMKLVAIYGVFELTKDELKVPADFPQILASLKGRDTIVWLGINGKAFKPSDTAGDAIAVPALRKMADLAAESGIRIALYPHIWFWNERTEDGVRLAKAVDRPNFGASFNLCHALALGDEGRVMELIDLAAPHLFLVSINGADAGGKLVKGEHGWVELVKPLGEGTYDVVPVLKKLRAVGYKGPIGFQGYQTKGDRLDVLTRTMNGWRKYSVAAAR
jgi:sugar phosphate isomerase/epimerase